MTTATLQSRASTLVSREVLCCVSGLVSTLAKAQGSRWRAIEQEEIYGLTEQAFELSTSIPDYESAAREAGWTVRPATVSDTGVASDPCVVRGTTAEDEERAHGFKYAEDWHEACEEDGIEPHDREVYEHWAVSTWLADKLEAKGEKVDRDFAGLIVWARTTTGQAISIDYVIEQIVVETGYAGG